jgi:2,4-dienoyl-CoA reductase (NADPH2)
MMAGIVLSIPEILVLRRVLPPSLIAVFITLVAVGIVIVGFLFNALDLGSVAALHLACAGWRIRRELMTGTGLKRGDEAMLDLRNRYLFAPIKTGYSDGTGQVTNRHLAFYRERSRHVGAVIPEPFYLDRSLRELPTQMGIDSDDKLVGLRRLTATIHANDGAAVAHLNHPGRMANPRIPGNTFLSSTNEPCAHSGGATPKVMDEADMDHVVQLFVAGAQRAREAGFDAIELQLGHGYLLAQFLSPLVNTRTDAWGGDFAARSRFPLKVVDAVRESVDLPLLVRVSGSEMIPGGIDVRESTALALELKKRDVAAVHVSAGTLCNTAPWFFQHMFVPAGKTWDMAEAIGREAGVRVVVVGRINSVEDAQRLSARFPNDYLAVGRGLVADPDFVGKAIGAVEGPVRPCLACAEGCLGGVRASLGLQCLVNPLVGREELKVVPAERPKSFAVVGGGLAGMEAAITLAERGHSVDLFEAERLGGQFNLAPLTPNKRSMGRLVPYLTQEVHRRGVRVIERRAAAPDLLEYDSIVVATGSRPQQLHVPGMDSYRWADILADDELPKGEHVLIIGGGLIGVDVATALVPRENEVTIVKRTEDFGEDMEMIAKNLSLKTMSDSEVRFSDHTHIERMEGHTVHAVRDGEHIRFEDVDLVIIVTGMASDAALVAELQGAIPVIAVGDAKRVGNAQDAITDAFLTAREL